jgi:hypothetical protein
MCEPQEKRDHLRKMGQLLQEFDVDQSGDLNSSEIKNLITQHGIRIGKHKPTEPTEEEIAWILQAAGKHRENAITVTELDFALKLWEEYVRNRAKYEKVCSITPNTRHTNQLEFDQLKQYLAKSTGFSPKVRKCLARSSSCAFFVCVFANGTA